MSSPIPLEAAGPSPLEVNTWLQSLFDESPMAIGFSRDGVMLDANKAYTRLFGYDDIGELRGRSILEQIAPSHRTRVIDLVTRRARGEQTALRYQTRGLRRDGTEFPFEITTTRVVVADGPLTLAFITDVSERDDALEALRASEEMFRTLAGAALDGVFVHADGKIVLANERGAAMYGYDTTSMVGVSIMDLAAPEERARLADQVRRGTSDPYEGLARRKDGSTFIVEVRGRTLFHRGQATRVAIIRDVTEQRRAEAEQHALVERMRHAQKLESLGVLAGGVAHDFNNILTVITNGVALAKQTHDLNPASAAHLDSIAIAAERAADLCRQMLAYAGKGTLTREAVDLGALVTEMSSMLEVSIAKKVTLARNLAPNLPLLRGDVTQIRQVVMNLVLNASEAIAGPRGTVAVSTGSGYCDAAALTRSVAGGDPRAGVYVYLDVRDDGIGMDAQTLAQMFDPFFTTKFVGRGLGMATVLGIVRAHSGAIDLESGPGKGTRIRILFPVSASAERLGPSARPPTKASAGGVVLIVDDEKNVRITTQLLLEGFGFEVLVARDGSEAVEAFAEHFARIGAVLLDLSMPRMDGVETLKNLRRIAPEVPVILTTGGGAGRLEELLMGPEAGGAPDVVLAKPYFADQLLSTLHTVMRVKRPSND